MNKAWWPNTSLIPKESGVYKYSDHTGRIIYVGKAKNLRDRLSSYFHNEAGLTEKTKRLLETATKVEWTITSSEVEALVLEQQWIQQYDPRFNIKLKDGKQYPSLAVTLQEEYPRLLIWRGKRIKGPRYFGPFPPGTNLIEIYESLQRAFQVRSCRPSIFNAAKRAEKPCLLADIGKCSAPCVKRISKEEHKEKINNLILFMEGKNESILKTLQEEMQKAARDQKYEKAARKRDDMEAIKRVRQKQNIFLEGKENVDIYAIATDELTESWYGLHVREGMLKSVENFLVENNEGSLEEKSKEFIERILTIKQNAKDLESKKEITKTIILPADLSKNETLTDFAKNLTGLTITFTDKKRKWADLYLIAETNAKEALKTEKLKRASSTKSRNDALVDLKEILELKNVPFRIESYDISHNQGTDAVGSMVVFEDALVKSSMHRIFNISTENSGNDYGSMKEVLTRRFSRQKALEAGVDTKTGEILGKVAAAKQKRFAAWPDLLLIDGGSIQVQAAKEVLEELNITTVAVVGLAKRMEEIWQVDAQYPIILSRESEVLYLLQRIRDEAHRFAIKNHRNKARKHVKESELDKIPGLGQKKKQDLLNEFKSVSRLKTASLEEICTVKGINKILAQKIKEHLA